MVGRPKGSKAPRHLSMETKAKLQARKELRDKEKELAKLERKIAKKRNNLNEKKRYLQRLNLRLTQSDNKLPIKIQLLLSQSLRKHRNKFETL